MRDTRTDRMSGVHTITYKLISTSLKDVVRLFRPMFELCAMQIRHNKIPDITKLKSQGAGDECHRGTDRGMFIYVLR